MNIGLAWWPSTAQAVIDAMAVDDSIEVEVDSIGAGDDKIESVRDALGRISLHRKAGLAWSGSVSNFNPLAEWGIKYDPATIDNSASTYTQQLLWTLYYGEWQAQLCDAPGGTDSIIYPVNRPPSH